MIPLSVVFRRKWGSRGSWRAWEHVAIEEEKVSKLQGGCAHGRSGETRGAVAAGAGQ